jgi:hypothetical protein
MVDNRITELNEILSNVKLGGYTLSKQPIGTGQFSAGYKASAKGKQPIFVKVPLEGMFHDPFRAVAEAHSSIQGTHPSVARFLELKEFPGPMGTLPAILTEYCDFPSVKAHMELKDAPFGVKETTKIAGMALDGLDFVHSQGIFHGDVSPGNLRVGDGVVKLTDWFHQVFISFFPEKRETVSVYGGDYGPNAGFWYNADVAPTLLMRQTIKEPNAFTDLYMLSRTLNFMLTENYTDRLYVDEEDPDVVARMQELLDKGKPDLTEKQWKNLSKIRGARGYHSVAEMRADLEGVIGVDYEGVQQVYNALKQAIGNGKQKDGTNSNLSTVEQLYNTLLAFPLGDMKVKEVVNHAENEIIKGIGIPFYNSVDGACRLVESEVQKGKRTEKDFWNWHKQKTGGLKECLERIKQSQHLNQMLKGYTGPNNGEALY